MNLAQVRTELDRIDWAFPSTGTRDGSVHTIHRFPGNFIPQIPAHLVQILSKPGDVVLDPFAGSGTTVIEALQLKRSAVGIDRTRACAFIADAKLRAWRDGLQMETKDRLLADLAWRHLCHTEEPGRHGEGAHPTLSSWYSERTLAELRFLWKLVESVAPDQRAALELIFSDVLFTCASTGNALTSGGKTRRHHWGWVADNVMPSFRPDHDAISLFVDRLLGIEVSRASTSDSCKVAAVMRADARMLPLESSCVDLVVTSPPYVGMIDYSLANRLLYLWMGWELAEDKGGEIGARFKRKRKSFVDEYLNDMNACWSEIHRVLRPGSACAVVLGESRKFPGAAAQALENLGSLMPLIWGPVGRTPIRRRISDRDATEPTEFVAVFRRQ